MLSVKGKFDGSQIILSDKVPFTKEMEVLITFLEKRPSSQPRDWRSLKGSAKRVALTQRLLESREKDRLSER